MRRLDPREEPVAHLRVVDVHELITDSVTIDPLKLGQHLLQFHRPTSRKKHCLRILGKLVFIEAQRFRVQGRDRRGITPEGVQPRAQVPQLAES